VNPAAAVAAGVAGSIVLGAVAQLLPAASSVRKARIRWAPALAGVGSAGHVALTFDDGPDPGSTPAFLDALDDLGWQATFFMLGHMAAAHPELAAEVGRRGHEVAVHGYFHSNHLRRGPGWTRRDVLAARDLLAEVTGPPPAWLRPPYGALAASTLSAARAAGLRPVLWTTWGRDWREEATPESIVEDVTTTLVPGATVLLHDSDCTSALGSWKNTLAALPMLAERWQAAGLDVGPLREHGLVGGSLGLAKGGRVQPAVDRTGGPGAAGGSGRTGGPGAAGGSGRTGGSGAADGR
jgi:peptidoglycan/xylan/chitin deacetylase (PgdA/CDA1 family)